MEGKTLEFVCNILPIGRAKKRLIFKQESRQGTTYYTFFVGNQSHGDFYGISQEELNEVEQKIMSISGREVRIDEILPVIKAHIKDRLPSLESAYRSQAKDRIREICFLLCDVRKTLKSEEGKSGSVEFYKKNTNSFAPDLPTQSSSHTSSIFQSLTQEKKIELFENAFEKTQSKEVDGWKKSGDIAKVLEKILRKSVSEYEKINAKQVRKLAEKSSKFEIQKRDETYFIRKKTILPNK